MNLDNYERVKSRKRRFYKSHPDGRILVDEVSSNDRHAKFRATLYKTAEDQKLELPLSTGYSLSIAGGSGADRTSWTENCEESAVGRALDNGGFCPDDNCSREEIENAKSNSNALKERLSRNDEAHPHLQAKYIEKENILSIMREKLKLVKNNDVWVNKKIAEQRKLEVDQIKENLSKL